MKVQFKRTGSLCSYEVLGENEEEYLLPVLGWVPKEELVEHTGDLPDIKDVLVNLSNKGLI